MSDYTDIRKSMKTFDSSPVFDPYSMVIITVSDSEVYFAGDDTGRILRVENPWGTQRMADNLLLQIKGYQYQPFSATGALLSPSAELGDGIIINGIKSRIFTQDITFGSMFTSDISAPEGEELDHEYPYFSSKERKVQRQLSNVKHTQNSQAESIQSRVPSYGGNSEELHWGINELAWLIKSADTILFSASKTALFIRAEGVFSGDTYAGKILHGNDYGTLSGKALTDASVSVDKLEPALAALLKGVSKKSINITDDTGAATTINYLAWEV